MTIHAEFKLLIRLLAFCCVATFLLAASRTNVADDGHAANGWRSFQNAGHIASPDEDLPVRWSPEENIAWQAEIEGYGQSAPVVSGETVVVTSVSGKMKDKYHLSAFNVKSGELSWKQDFDNPSPVENTFYVSRAAPTAVADDAGFIAYFEGGLVAAVTHQGEIRWQRNVAKDYGDISARHGLSSSLEQNDQHVFVWVERSEEPYLMALDKKSGEAVWKVAGLGATSWSSPRLVPTIDGDQLVCSASGKLVGFNPASGERLWEFDEISNNTSCTPMPIGKGRFLIGASDGRGEENAGKGAVSNGVIEITKAEDGSYSADFLWHATKASSSFGSPVAVDDQVFIVNRSGVLFTLDLETGKQESTARIASGSIWATPLVADGKLYLFGNKGTTSVISLADGKELAENRLWEGAAPKPAAAGSRPSFGGGPVLYAATPASPYLILRRGDRLYAVKSEG